MSLCFPSCSVFGIHSRGVKGWYLQDDFLHSPARRTNTVHAHNTVNKSHYTRSMIPKSTLYDSIYIKFKKQEKLLRGVRSQASGCPWAGRRRWSGCWSCSTSWCRCRVHEHVQFVKIRRPDAKHTFLMYMSIESFKKIIFLVPFLPAIPLIGLCSVLGSWKPFLLLHPTPILWVNL